MEREIPVVVERKKPLASFRSGIVKTGNQTVACNEPLIYKLHLVLWWSLYIQLFPGISFIITGKMKRNIRIINAKKEEPAKFYRHILFTLIPGTFFSLYQVKDKISF